MRKIILAIISITVLSNSSCKVKTGANQPPVKSVIGVYRPFSSTLPNTTNDVNFKCKYFTKVTNNNNQITTYDSKLVFKTRNATNKTEQYWEVDLNLPLQYAGYAVNVFIEWTECAWPNSINVNSAIEEFEALSPIYTSPQNVVLTANMFTSIFQTQC